MAQYTIKIARAVTFIESISVEVNASNEEMAHAAAEAWVKHGDGKTVTDDASGATGVVTRLLDNGWGWFEGRRAVTNPTTAIIEKKPE